MSEKPKGILTKDQKRFITNRVKKLGSLAEVNKAYNRKDTVSTFARELAGKLYPIKKLKLRSKK